MAFEIRLVDQEPIYGGSDPVVCRFTDEEWWNLLSLAHECGFDPNKEYISLVCPANAGETHELDGIYIGVSMVLNQDTLPFATTWESDDGRLRFRWAKAPDYAPDREPEETRDAADNPDFALDESDLQLLLECLGKTRVLAARVGD